MPIISVYFMVIQRGYSAHNKKYISAILVLIDVEIKKSKNSFMIIYK